jgi:hypothetical protein
MIEGRTMESTKMSAMKVLALAVVSLAALPAGLRGADAPMPIVLTADREGQVDVCGDCPGQAGLGGLGRLATLVAGLRAKGPLVLVDAGNGLIGPESLESGGKVIAAAWAVLGVDAANLSWRDFRLGRDATLRLVREMKIPAVSANLLDAATRQQLAPPYLVVGKGGGKVAVLGLTSAPPGGVLLPHLARQLEGIQVEPPLEALAKWLPKAKADAGTAVLAWHGPAADLRAIIEKHGADLAAVLAGGIRPSELPASTRPPIAAAADRGQGVSLLRDGKVEEIALGAWIESDAEMEKVIASFPRRPARIEIAGTAGQAAAPAAGDHRPGTAGKVRVSGTVLREPPGLGKDARLDLAGSNRAVKIAVRSVGLHDRLGDTRTPAGKRFLVVGMEWENTIPLRRVEGQDLPTKYLVPDLGDHLYAVIDGRRLGRIAEGAQGIPGHLPVAPFGLERPGSRATGSAIFTIPDRPFREAILVFYDFNRGSVEFPLVSAGPLEEEKPREAKRNEVVELGLFGLSKAQAIGDRKAPAGQTFLRIELRARSLMTIEADASSYESGGASKFTMGTVADWKESRRYTQVVADGEHALFALPASELAEEPRFLPEPFTGGELLFLIPEKTSSLELRCDFPNAVSSTGGGVFKPSAIVFALEGARPALPARAAVVEMKDEFLRVAVTGQEVASEFAGAKAGRGEKFLLLDVTVTNPGKGGELFQTREQVQHVAEGGQKSACDEASLLGVYPPADPLWIPAGEARSFRLAFRIPAGETRPRIAYTAASEGASGVFDLKTIPKDAPPAATTSVAGAPAATATEGPSTAKGATPETKAAPAKAAVAKTEGTAPSPLIPPEGTKAAAPATPAKVVEPAEKKVSPPPKAVEPEEKAAPPAAVAKAAPKVRLEPKGLAGVGLKAEDVNRAIDRGAEYLKGPFREGLDQSDQYHFLYALALVHAGAHKKDPTLAAEILGLLSKFDPLEYGTYPSGVVAMAVEGLGDPRAFPALRRSARYLVEAQGEGGSWSYNAKEIPKEIIGGPGAGSRKALQVTGGMPLEGPGSAGEAWKRLTSWDVGIDGDTSASQFALLGLYSSARSGIPIPAESWKRALAAYRERQCEDGGWNYGNGGKEGYGSMTCAGICSVALCRHFLGEKEAGRDPAIDRGLEWLSTHFTVTENPGNSEEWVFYYLYSLERVGRILDTEFIGDHEWYPLGARRLVGMQNDDGSWVGTSGEEKDPPIATSFTLLFLTRATPTLEVASRMRGGKGILKTDSSIPPGQRVYVILDASGSMLSSMGGRTKMDIARDAVEKIAGDLPAGTEVALRVYGNRKSSIEEGADEDSTLEIPMGPLDRAAFIRTLRAVRCRGRTPLALSLDKAAEDIAAVSADRRTLTVLLTDGGEDTTQRRDPVKAAEAFAEAAPGAVLQVVGFDIGRDDWSAQLRAIAAKGRGTYFPARRADELAATLRQSVFGAPDRFEVTDAAGRTLTSGRFGDEKTLAEGQYRLKAPWGSRIFEEEFWINTDAVTVVIFDAAVAGAPEGRAPSPLIPPEGKAPAGAVPPAAAPPTPVAKEAPPAEPAPVAPTTPAAGAKKAAPPAADPAAGPKFCTECGKPVKPADRFCTSCGKPVKRS